MGYRSTFITNDFYEEIPDWFVEKYHDKLQNVGAGRHQSIKRKEQNNANSESKDKL